MNSNTIIDPGTLEIWDGNGMESLREFMKISGDFGNTSTPKSPIKVSIPETEMTKHDIYRESIKTLLNTKKYILKKLSTNDDRREELEKMVRDIDWIIKIREINENQEELNG